MTGDQRKQRDDGSLLCLPRDKLGEIYFELFCIDSLSHSQPVNTCAAKNTIGIGFLCSWVQHGVVVGHTCSSEMSCRVRISACKVCTTILFIISTCLMQTSGYHHHHGHHLCALNSVAGSEAKVIACIVFRRLKILQHIIGSVWINISNICLMWWPDLATLEYFIFSHSIKDDSDNITNN